MQKKICESTEDEEDVRRLKSREEDSEQKKHSKEKQKNCTSWIEKISFPKY